MKTSVGILTQITLNIYIYVNLGRIYIFMVLSLKHVSLFRPAFIYLLLDVLLLSLICCIIFLIKVFYIFC